jgi:hypothetical protein
MTHSVLSDYRIAISGRLSDLNKYILFQEECGMVDGQTLVNHKQLQNMEG